MNLGEHSERGRKRPDGPKTRIPRPESAKLRLRGHRRPSKRNRPSELRTRRVPRLQPRPRPRTREGVRPRSAGGPPPARLLAHAHSRSDRPRPTRHSRPRARSPAVPLLRPRTQSQPETGAPAAPTCPVTEARPAGQCRLGSASAPGTGTAYPGDAPPSRRRRYHGNARAGAHTPGWGGAPGLFPAQCSDLQTFGTRAAAPTPPPSDQEGPESPTPPVTVARHAGARLRRGRPRTRSPAVLSACCSRTPAPPPEPREPTREASSRCYSFSSGTALKRPGAAAVAFPRCSGRGAGPKGRARGALRRRPRPGG